MSASGPSGPLVLIGLGKNSSNIISSYGHGPWYVALVMWALESLSK